MTILVTISSWGTNTGPYYKIIALPGGTVISAIESQWIGPKMFTNVPAGTTSVRMESINYNGTPGLCGSTDIPVTLLDATTTTTTTGGVVPPSPTTTTTTTSGGIPPTTTTTTSSSTSSTTTTTTTSGGTPPTTTTTTTGGQPEPPTTTTTTTELPFVDQSFCWTLHIPVDVLTSGTDVLWAYRQLEGQQNSWVQLMYTDPPVEGYVYACICSVGEPMYGYAPNGGPAPAQTQDIMSIEPTNTCNHCTGDGECGSCWELEDLCTTSTTTFVPTTTTTTTTCECGMIPYVSWSDQNGGQIEYGCSLSLVAPCTTSADMDYDFEIGFSVDGGAKSYYVVTVLAGATSGDGLPIPQETIVTISGVSIDLVGPTGGMFIDVEPFVCQDLDYVPTTTTTTTVGPLQNYFVCVGIDNARSGEYVYTCVNPINMWMHHTSNVLSVGAQLFDDESMTTYTQGAGYVQQGGSYTIYTISAGGYVQYETAYICSGPGTPTCPETTTTTTTGEPVCTQVLDNGQSLYGYSAVSAYNACNDATPDVQLWGDNAAFLSATKIYSANDCQSYAPAGYYAGQGYDNVRLWTGSSFADNGVLCSTLTTTTTNPV